MHSTKVKRADLLAKIKGNRDAHRALFLKAQEGFRARVVEELDEMLKDAREGKQLRTVVRLAAPEDHTIEYDRVIDMLEMSEEAIVEIDSQSFLQYVRNEWQWFSRASATNSLYASGGKISQ